MRCDLAAAARSGARQSTKYLGGAVLGVGWSGRMFRVAARRARLGWPRRMAVRAGRQRPERCVAGVRPHCAGDLGVRCSSNGCLRERAHSAGPDVPHQGALGLAVGRISRVVCDAGWLDLAPTGPRTAAVVHWLLTEGAREGGLRIPHTLRVLGSPAT